MRKFAPAYLVVYGSQRAHTKLLVLTRSPPAPALRDKNNLLSKFEQFRDFYDSTVVKKEIVL